MIPDTMKKCDCLSEIPIPSSLRKSKSFDSEYLLGAMNLLSPSFPSSVTVNFSLFPESQPLLSHHLKHCLQTLLMNWSLMSPTKAFSFRRGYTLSTSLSASSSTTRRSKQLHFDPGKIAVMVCTGSATHPPEDHPWLVLKIPAEYPENPLREAKLHRPSPYHIQLHHLKSFY